MSIRISEKHGVNPSLDTCFFCGEPKAVVMFGKLKGDAEAPRKVMLNYEPCGDCAKKMAEGITCVEVTTQANGMPPIQDELYPTGRWCVIKKEAAKAVFNNDSSKMLLEDKVFEWLMSQDKK